MKDHRAATTVLLTVLLSFGAGAQVDSVRVARPFVAGGIYDKPFITRLGGKTTIGGYMDIIGGFTREAGINEGWSFEARRFNLFTYSVLADGIIVTSEIEIEHGGEEFKLEYGLLDIEFHEAVNLRGGIILSPLGKTNLVHDSPKLELVERPLMSTEIIPSTLSEVGGGFFGAFYPGEISRMTYEVYAVNGFNQDVIEGGVGTRIAEGKGTLFEEDNNGEPAVVGRVAFSPRFGSEIGASFHTGAYNIFRVEGLDVDRRRSLTILAADAEHVQDWLHLQAEYAQARIQVPPQLRGIYAERQHGGFLQANVPVVRGLFDRWPRSKLTASLRYEFVDFDRDLKGEDHQRLTLGLNVRFIQDAVLKFNYEQNWMTDRENNLTRSVRL
ncbi:MAG: hypothetical protein HYW57_09255, partial [Ignavibacteriales bacterium]|nr:hypothetical protein [Ignavibacteriales bacterium]